MTGSTPVLPTMITITFEVDKFTTRAELYDIDFGGSRRRRIYDLEPGKTNVLVLPVSMEDWEFVGCDGGCMLVLFGERKRCMLALFGERKRGKPYEYTLRKSECKAEEYITPVSVSPDGEGVSLQN